ncbi:MAG: ATP-dependent RNA helicase, partial [Spirochaetaceae bacterium]|nr:ATP-dependent RNA helicase [Spirochaetaceae bacterium]
EAARLAVAGDILLKGLKGRIKINGKYRLFDGEKLNLILRLARELDIDGAVGRDWPQKKVFSPSEEPDALLEVLPLVLAPTRWKAGKKDFGFICLTNSEGAYSLNCSRGFHNALNESLSSLESLIDELGDNAGTEDRAIVNQTFRRLSGYLNF